MRFLSIALLCAGLLSQQAAVAGPAADTLATCLKDHTNGKDRKALVRWIFISVSAHPEIGDLTSISEPTRVDSNKYVADMITRLITESCPAQTRAVVKEDGGQGLMAAFKALGETASMELMTHPAVGASVGGYIQFLDKKKFDAVLGK